ncbi:hypothetical protein ABEV34_10545 [Methylorubrum rhodesianum]|uniref:hypothetical protein n=1 Tax=Methylorubrum TaxID=2282523 RepID=UPI0018E3EE89|nr:hypothetical protein [Methylorubrum sp. DB1722]MBI1691044.1 hypothetical protein [Methylorubrum sp. DB1722]
MDDEVLDLLGRLASVRREMGDAVYRDALERAVIGIGVAAHIEAERRALRHARLRPTGNVVLLPRRCPADLGPGGDDVA